MHFLAPVAKRLGLARWPRDPDATAVGEGVLHRPQLGEVPAGRRRQADRLRAVGAARRQGRSVVPRLRRTGWTLARGRPGLPCHDRAEGVRVIVVNRFATLAGGADKHAVELARHLRARGHAVRFLSTASDRNAERDGEFVPLLGSDFWRGTPPLRDSARVAAGALWNRRAAAAMDSLIAQLQPDVVHLHDIYPQLSVAPVVVAARRGVPIVQTLHNYELISANPADERGGWLDRSDAPASIRALRAALKLTRKLLHVPRVTLWIAVSRYVAEVYAGHGIEAEVLPNFIEPPAPGLAAGFEERTGIVFMGRLTKEKGAPDAVVLARRLPGIGVTILGRGPLEQQVRRAAHELPNLDFPGFLDEQALAARLRSARLLAVPSRWQEPAGLVALEAMANGTPVVAYASGGLAEYVREADAGRVVSASVEPLADACRELYEDRKAWEEAAASGRAAVAGVHSPDRYAELVERLYERASSRR
jgi:glycosyltransferase involved in cell wall biosynthesis